MSLVSSRVLAVHTGKGGAKKTSLVCNIAGLVAAAGYRTLIVDVDPQGNCGEDLGYTNNADGGAALRRAIETGSRLVPINVRPNLDVVPGGPELARHDDQTDSLTWLDKLAATTDPHRLLRAPLGQVAADYDLVLIDTPPGGVTIKLALGAARWLLVPAAPDRSSIKGIALVAEALDLARRHNPDLDLLGVILVDIPTQATRIAATARDNLTTVLGGGQALFATTLRTAPKAAQMGRELGKLAHELAEEAAGAPAWEYLRKGLRIPDRADRAGQLAQDYMHITEELLDRITAAEEGR